MKRAVILISMMLAALFLFGCTQKTVNTQTTDSQQPITGGLLAMQVITIKDFSFTPSTLTIKAGTTVRWVNEDSTAHTVKFPEFVSSTIGRGDTYEHKFDTAVTYDYSCGIHSSMKGRIMVE